MKKQKALGNKGFSLVELIVVIAIMAILVGLLAPTLIKYVGNATSSKDAANTDEIKRVAEIAISNCYDELKADATGTSAKFIYSLTGNDAGELAVTSGPDEFCDAFEYGFGTDNIKKLGTTNTWVITITGDNTDNKGWSFTASVAMNPSATE